MSKFKLVLVAVLMTVACGGQSPVAVDVPVLSVSDGTVASFVVPSPTPTPTPEPTEEPVRRNNKPTPEPTREPEPEEAAPSTRVFPTPTPWMSCDNPDFAPPSNMTVRAETSINPTTVNVYRLIASIGNDEVMGGITSPWVGAGTTLSYARGATDTTVHFTWTLRNSIAGGELVCYTVKSVDVLIPAY